MTSIDLRQLAHRAMALTPSPWLRHAKNARHLVQDGIAFNRQDPAGPSFNYAAVLGVTPSLDRVLALAREFFRGETEYGVLVEGDVGHPVEAELRARGWRVFEDEPALVLPEILDYPNLVPTLTIVMVQDESGLKDFEQTLATAFMTPPELRETFAPTLAMARDPEMRLFLGYCDGQPVSGVTLICTAGIAVIAGTATLAEFRGRGYGAALTRAALAEGARRGCTSGALRSGPLSVPLYQRLGFILACQHRTYAPK